MQTKEEISKTILYLPVTNGKSEESIAFGANLIDEFCNQQTSALQSKLSETTKLLKEAEATIEPLQDKCIFLEATITSLNGIIDTQKQTEDILLEKIQLGEARIKELEEALKGLVQEISDLYVKYKRKY